MIQLPNLPFEFGALEPFIDAQTIELHYTKHHQGYVNKLNELIQGTEFETKDLETIIKTVSQGPIFNNAAQIRNHTFYRNSLRTAQENNTPTTTILDQISAKRGSFDDFKQAFTNSAISNFGAGRTWLIKNQEGQLEILNTSNAQTPITNELTPLFTIDVREHAYYLKYQNRRPEYVANFRNIINRDFVSKNYTD